MKPDQYIERDKSFVWHHLVQHKPYLDGEPPIFVKGEGCTLTNIHGKEFLDAVSGGVWCVNVGYGRDRIARSVYEQLSTMPYYALTAGNLPAIELAEKVVNLMPGLPRRAFFSNSGSEANEKAFKMSRLYAQLTGSKQKTKILYRHRDYHGTTIAALSATGQEERRAGFGPLVPDFEMVPEAFCYRCPFGKTYPNCEIDCAKAVESKILEFGADRVAAFIVEPITAGGGILEPVKEYFPMVQAICKKHDVLLIMDEVVCGFGRTGTWFGYQHFDVQPDIVTMAKGMASAYQPISCTVASNQIFDAFVTEPSDKFGYFRDISTYGGCAGSCAAALENIKIIEEENLLNRVKEAGKYLFDRLHELSDMPYVGDIRGKGLFAGIEFVKNKKTKEPVDEGFVAGILGHAYQNGILLGRMNRSVPLLNNVLTMSPAYIVTNNEIDRIVDAIRAGIEAQTTP
ncbi:aspartate aminotransferase family protein [Oleidesulfovibrio sp.]|uniref:aminotransferase family protein n=1 Tax=Oleidesulfovibrio sp. TaxID=2909707 RepID=UPI003A8362C4